MAREPPADFYGDEVDQNVFEQILLMDDDDGDGDFSKQIVMDFLEQVVSTFKKMDEELAAKDLPELSALGHFLKGSSATLGFNQIRDACEKIQHFGSQKDESGEEHIDDKELCLRKIRDAIREAKVAFTAVSAKMRDFYGQQESP